MGLSILLGAPLFVYLLIVAALYFKQTSLIFPTAYVAAAGPPPAGSERLQLEIAPGIHLRGLRIAPAGSGAEAPLILAFPGNATNAESAAAYLHGLFPEAEVVAFHYRGYRPSGGTPDAAALQADALRIYDWVQARRPRRIILVGFSVGSGIAAYLAGQRRAAGLILVTPFDSLARVAAFHYPWLPVTLLLRHRLEPATDLHDSRLPVAVIAGGRDTLIPAVRTEALRRAVPNLAFSATIADAGHNDIYDRPQFRMAMQAAFRRLDPRRRS